MADKAFKFAGFNFLEVIKGGQRSVVLRLANPEEEFIARSEQFLREEAAAFILKSGPVMERLRRCDTDGKSVAAGSESEKTNQQHA